MRSKIIAISGKKQSGKTSICSYLKYWLYYKYKSFDISNIIQYDNGDIGFRDPYNDSDIDEYVKIYSFADSLKNFLVDVMGLTYNQVHGTDDDKNTLTEYKWDNIPLYIRWNFSGRKIFDGTCISDEYLLKNNYSIESYFSKFVLNTLDLKVLKSGQMTARELMMVMGTDIMRKMFSEEIWVKSTIRNIKKDNPVYALICDMRFPSEINEVRKYDHTIIRLMKSDFNINHQSENALDNYQFWNTSNAYFIDNSNLNISQKNLLITSILEKENNSTINKVAENV